MEIKKQKIGAKIKSKIDIKKRIKKSKNTTEPYKIACSKKESIKIIVKTIKKIQKIKEINFS